LGSSSRPPPPTWNTIGTPASCATAQTGNSPVWLGECPGGQADGIIKALQPSRTASSAIARARSKSASGT
jgi:hypothetical protein